MRKLLWILQVVAPFVGLSGAVSAETLFPAGHNIRSDYSINEVTPMAGDTVEVVRTIVNDEAYVLTGLYFSENLPPEFQVIDDEIRVNGSSITYDYGGPLAESIVSGYEVHRWMVDSPDPGHSIQNELSSGDSLVFNLRLTCNTPGSYTLPLHTTTLFGNATGFFSTAEPLVITIIAGADIMPPGTVSDLTAE